ncbi:MAG TPA: glycosyltransferase family 4 protein, partial [Vineibacter sp.]|nr:glycosyltransferase family 4 protein [Vineibacter sp.]
AAGGRALIAGPDGPLAGEMRRLKVTHVRLPADTDSLPQAYGTARRLRETVATYGVEIIHARSRAAAWAARRLARGGSIKVVVTAHAPARGERWAARLMERAQAQADALIAVSDFVAASLKAHQRIDDGRISVIRSGINFDRFNPATVRAERLIKLAARWRLPDDRKVILFPGRLCEDRGQIHLVEAIKALDREDVFCLLLGAESSPTALEERLKRHIERLGLGGTVAIAPFCDDMPAAYMLSDVVVAGGNGQGFSRALVEAQAMSRPVVCDAGCGAVEGMVPGETGWTATPGAPSALAQALNRALALTAEQRAQLSMSAQAHVRAHFTIEAMCRRTLDLYQRVAGSRGRRAQSRTWRHRHA